MKRIPQVSPKGMANQLAGSYIRPIAVAEQNKAVAKTKDSLRYWKEVIANLRVLCN